MTSERTALEWKVLNVFISRTAMTDGICHDVGIVVRFWPTQQVTVYLHWHQGATGRAWKACEVRLMNPREMGTTRWSWSAVRG